jgi:uncharacterized membrane protein
MVKKIGPSSRFLNTSVACICLSYLQCNAYHKYMLSIPILAKDVSVVVDAWRDKDGDMTVKEGVTERGGSWTREDKALEKRIL